MSRIKDLQKYVHHVVEGNEKEANQIAHLHGVALAAAILAMERRGRFFTFRFWTGLPFCSVAHIVPGAGLCQAGSRL